MSEYIARVGTSSGEIIERAFVSESEDALRRELDGKGFYIFSIDRKVGDIRMPWQRKRKIPAREFSVFNHELATLLKAGLPLLQGLDILLERMQNPFFRDMLHEIRDQVRGGTALSDAFAAYPEYFPPLYSASLKAGERSGEMETVIRRYMQYQKVIDEVRKRVIAALVYPSVLFTFSIICVVVLLKVAIPKFANLYASFDTELPVATQILLKVSDAVNQHWLLLIVAAFAAVTALRMGVRTDRGREAVDRAKLRLPFVGPVLQKFSVSQLTRALATLLKGGIPLVTALEIAAGSVGNSLIARKSRGAVKEIREGEPLSVGLENTGVVQPMVIEMVKVGESTGALDEMLGNVADYFDEDISNDLERLLTLLEPLLLIVMGGIIAFMLGAMYLPIFQMQSAIPN